ncbi:LysR family transcriptional regulator [Clostridium akagii]|uniref:LysR family transcriptional regulator n=1 Tax=Clostridium akagii TaxID=91623 RepID=UPI000478F80D|nr:LysR family transcriptional regulator [Clostridium akagii]
MEIRNLKTFSTIAKVGSFTRAADILGYAQSTITTQIKVLEVQLNTKLFDRLGRNIFLTSDGEKLLKYAEQILKLSSEAEDVVGGSEITKGTLTIGAVESLCVIRLPGILKKYHELYPKVDIIIKLATDSNLRSYLKNNTIDVAIFLGKEVYDEDLISKTKFYEPMIVLSSPSHPISKLKSITADNLSSESLILNEKGCSYCTMFEAMLNKAGVYPKSILEVGSIQAIKQFTMSNLGITFLPRMAVEKELQEGQLAELNWHGPDINVMSQVMYHKDRWISPAMKAFLDLIHGLQDEKLN